jgi:hypothetical protein
VVALGLVEVAVLARFGHVLKVYMNMKKPELTVADAV